MRVLAHIHTFNDTSVIDQALDSLTKQTHPLDAILIVDNGSTDGTLDRAFSEHVSVIRNDTNLGTSGAVRCGFIHAVEHQFDWIWVFDADSTPEQGALEELLAFFERLPASAREQVCFLACWPMTASGGIKERPIIFTDSGIRYLSLKVDAGYSRCDCNLWSGSLYRTAAIEKIGLPSADYVLDVGELEYGYRARQLGLTSYIVHSGVIHTDVNRNPASTRICRFGSIAFPLYEVPPIRCYYSARNWIYFWLYQCKPRRVGRIVRSLIRSIAFAITFLILRQRRQLVACLRGIRDGLTMHIERRY
jgi:GT2 family glycosyltransferase